MSNKETTMSTVKKKIVYSIKAKIYLDPDDNTCILNYLEPLQEVGEAKVVDVEVITDEEYNKL